MSKVLSLQQFKSGDVLLSSGPGFISRAIIFFTSLHTGKAKRSHAAALVGENLLVEALTKVRINPINKYDDKRQGVSVWRLPIGDKDRKRFREEMIKVANQNYGWGKIALFAFDAIATGISRLFGNKEPLFPFSQAAKVKSFQVCSQLVVWGIHKFTQVRILDKDQKEVDWRIVTPDYLEDLLKLEHNGAELLYKRENA